MIRTQRPLWVCEFLSFPIPSWEQGWITYHRKILPTLNHKAGCTFQLSAWLTVWFGIIFFMFTRVYRSLTRLSSGEYTDARRKRMGIFLFSCSRQCYLPHLMYAQPCITLWRAVQYQIAKKSANTAVHTSSYDSESWLWYYSLRTRYTL